MVKNPLANSGDVRGAGSIPGLGRSSREWHGNPLQYSGLENPMDRGAWRATVHGVAKSQTRLKRLSTCACRIIKRPVRLTKRWGNILQDSGQVWGKRCVQMPAVGCGLRVGGWWNLPGRLGRHSLLRSY